MQHKQFDQYGFGPGTAGSESKSKIPKTAYDDSVTYSLESGMQSYYLAPSPTTDHWTMSD